MFRAVRPICVALLITAFVVGQSASWLHVAAHFHDTADTHSHVHCGCDHNHCHSHDEQTDQGDSHGPAAPHDSHNCSICHLFFQHIDIAKPAIDLHFVEASRPLTLRKLDVSPLLAFVRVFATRGPPTLSA